MHDLLTYSEACLYADVGVHLLGGDFIVWDRVEKRPLYDSRKLAAKLEQSAPRRRGTTCGECGEELWTSVERSGLCARCQQKEG